MSTDVSEEHVAYIFEVEGWAKQETSVNEVARRSGYYVLQNEWGRDEKIGKYTHSLTVRMHSLVFV
jgi:hypothetical protein